MAYRIGVCMACIVAAGTGTLSHAQDANTELPPVTVTTSGKAKPAPKSAKGKTQSPSDPQPPSSSGDPSPAEAITPGNAVANAAVGALEARSEAPNATVVMEGAQLQQYNHLSVGDVVRRLPGVTFPGVNRSRDIKLRGIGKEYTQVLLDGRPLLDGDSSRSLEVDRIPASFIERIEIVRSPLASMTSAGAAGTVNIFTRRDYGPSGGQVTVGAGHMEGNGTPGELSAWQGGEAGLLTLTASNLLRADDKRALTTRDSSGVITSRTESIEPSPSLYYARLSMGW